MDESQLCARCYSEPMANMNTGLCDPCLRVDENKARIAAENILALAQQSVVATKDSGERRAFATGSQRDAATNKGRFDLLSPMVTRRDAGLMERGAVKYDARNWEKGQPLSVFLDCAMRHMQKHLMGYRDEDHLAAARWNIGGMMHTEHQIARGFLPAELDDLPCYVTDEERQSGEGW